MRITVFGTGYVGLVQGAVLAEVGHDVLCVDIDAAKVAGLKAGRIPIYEPGLEEHREEEPRRGPAELHHRRRRGRGATAASSSSPSARPPTRTARRTQVRARRSPRTIAEHMTEPKVVVTKSTVPVGTADKVRARLAEVLARPRLGSRLRRGLEPGVPEGGRRGRRLHAPRPHRHRHRQTPRPRSCCARSTRPFSRNHDKIIVMDVRSAELTKYAANCMLATKISFMNEMAEPRRAARRRRRGGAPGHRLGPAHRLPLHLSRRRLRRLLLPQGREGADRTPPARPASSRRCSQAVEDRNDAQKAVIFEKIARHYGGDLKGRTFALWGLAFKPQHRRHARGGLPGADGGALGGRREGAGLRPRGDGGGAAPLRRPRRPHCSAAPRRRRCAAPTRWSSSPSGRRSARRTST